MRYFMFALVALSSCAPTTRELQNVAAGPTDFVESLPAAFSAQHVKNDLEAAIVERFGSQALKRAHSAEAYVLSRHYQGLPPPPEPGQASRPPIAALLLLEEGVWYRAETGGTFSRLSADQQQQWLSALADTGPWSEPSYANPTCTDAGATYLIVSVPNRPYLLHAANCATPKSERLGLAAINL